jgi:hypothetical protein
MEELPFQKDRTQLKKTGKDCDFFACPDKSCNAAYQAKDGKPLFEKAKNK